MSPSTENYVLARGDAGARRLAILDQAMGPSSEALLRRAGLKPGDSFLDVGCGAGDLTRRIAGLGADAMGVDVDPGFVARARAASPHLSFECLDVADLPTLGRRFDVVYARYLLSHLADPSAGLRAMIAATRPGGAVVLEDIDFDLHVAQPRPAAFDRYLDLYRAVVQARGGNPILGRHLFHLAREAGLQGVDASVHVKVLTEGEAKHISSLTLAGIRDAAIPRGLATANEIDGLLADLEAFENDPNTLVSVAGTHQVFGIMPP